MEWTSLALIIASIIIVALLIVILSRASDDEPGQVGTQLIMSHDSVNIICPDPTDELIKYAMVWNYQINGKGQYHFHILDDYSHMNNDVSISEWIDIGGSSRYIAFAGRRSFITKSKTIHSRDSLEELLEREMTLSEYKLDVLLKTGFPYRGNRGTILHCNYLDQLLHSTKEVFPRHQLIHSSLPPRISPVLSSDFRKIPRIIHQCFETKMLPAMMISAVNSWVNKNPSYEHIYYDNGDMREFISKQFDKTVLMAYDSLIPGAYRADLWRLCILYFYGGVYVDIKMGANIPLDRIIGDTKLVLVTDRGQDIYNAFIAVIPEHPLIGELIKAVVDNVKNKVYGRDSLYPTGPGITGEVVDSYLGTSRQSTRDVTFLNFVHDKGDGRFGGIYNEHGDRLIETRHNKDLANYDFFKKISGVPHYGELWRTKLIYR